MRVKISVEAPYADFNTRPGKVGAIKRKVGNEIDYPDWYAKFLVDHNLAEQVQPSVDEGEKQAEKLPKDEGQPEPPVDEVAKADAERHGPSVSAADDEALEEAGFTKPRRGRKKS